MSYTCEHQRIIAEIASQLIVLSTALNRRMPTVFLSQYDYRSIDKIRVLLRQLEELDST